MCSALSVKHEVKNSAHNCILIETETLNRNIARQIIQLLDCRCSGAATTTSKFRRWIATELRRKCDAATLRLEDTRWASNWSDWSDPGDGIIVSFFLISWATGFYNNKNRQCHFFLVFEQSKSWVRFLLKWELLTAYCWVKFNAQIVE